MSILLMRPENDSLDPHAGQNEETILPSARVSMGEPSEAFRPQTPNIRFDLRCKPNFTLHLTGDHLQNKRVRLRISAIKTKKELKLSKKAIRVTFVSVCNLAGSTGR
ncbi:MAG: hypothetical protein D6675_09690 [Gemmatimonadetes bacterium]|nr:MAG: hypothetical protein D6675_09690 [Gemmatimonadota bacterium]